MYRQQMASVVRKSGIQPRYSVRDSVSHPISTSNYQLSNCPSPTFQRLRGIRQPEQVGLFGQITAARKPNIFQILTEFAGRSAAVPFCKHILNCGIVLCTLVWFLINLQGHTVMKFLDIGYSKLTFKELINLCYLRKITFKDRLHWQVSCRDDMEFDDVEGWCF